jgi:Flp pilus assembly protein TadD
LARWRSGDLAGALEALQEAISLRPSDAPTMLFAAAVSDEMGLVDEALKYARRAVEIAPENANAWAALGGALVKADEPVRAREAFARALELDPGNEIARKALSRPDRGGN